MGYRYVVHRRVVVNLLSGTAITGVITKTRGPLYVLRDAAVLRENGEAVPADGEIVVDKANVDYIQAVG
ncbi:Uncharacterised protein [Nocardia otitidiscaviarum]|uniref:Uncharacterized protein n=1 Tax=Nocardia otitidiscaviarum TaxID=1823 RepID=A0A378Y8G3_9NOCA|nr:hypothetical protein [Nocardia otitidiscaviarum]SUA72667.1 Uncharacterised protein [Nocardia otitidiscaviarum]